MIYIISESTYGKHHEINNSYDFKHYAFVFIANVDKYGNYVLLDNSMTREVMSNFSNKTDSIFISCDLDTKGEVMSYVLKESFIKLGVDEENIYRVPLCENGHLAISNFLSDSFAQEKSQLQKLENEWLAYCKEKKLGLFGFSKMLSLLSVSDFKQSGQDEFETKFSGSNTATYLLRYEQFKGVKNDG